MPSPSTLSPRHGRRGATRAGLLLALLTLTGRAAEAQTLRGSPESVEHAYRWAVANGLTFEPSSRSVQQAAARGTYVPLSHVSAYRLKGVSVPYALPATSAWVDDMASRYRRACGEPMTVTSALRPRTIHLRNSVRESVHPTGVAVDLRKPRGRCRDWLRSTLLDMERSGTIDATEERFPAHFHVVVYGAPAPAPSAATASPTKDTRVGGR